MTVQPEYIRREAMNEYARLQILKLKICLVLFAILLIHNYL